MNVVFQWLYPILLAGPMSAMDSKPTPVIFKVLLPLLLSIGVLTVAGIAVVSIINLLKKTEALEDESKNYGSLAVGDMTRYEAESKKQPVFGKVGTVIFLAAVGAFFFLGLYTMGRGSSTTAQLRKEGKAKSAAKINATKDVSSSNEIGEDGSDAMKGGAFDSLDGMK